MLFEAHRFIVVGYELRGDSWEPFLQSLEYSWDKVGESVRCEEMDREYLPPGGSYVLRSFGERLSLDEERVLGEQLEVSLCQDVGDPSQSFPVLLRAIRGKSKSGRGSVGDSAILSSIPLSYVKSLRAGRAGKASPRVEYSDVDARLVPFHKVYDLDNPEAPRSLQFVTDNVAMRVTVTRGTTSAWTPPIAYGWASAESPEGASGGSDEADR